MKAKIITVCKPTGNGVHSKFAIRRKYVREKFIPRLRDLGFDAEIFPAVTGADIEVEDGVAHIDGLSTTLGPQPAYVSTFLSHVMVWKWCAENEQSLLVCEDDARLPDKSVETVMAALKDYEGLDGDLPDLLYLQSELPYAKEQIRGYRPSEIEAAGGSLLRVTKVRDTSGAAAYVIRPAAARALVKRFMECEQNSPDYYFHVAHAEGRIGVLVPKDFCNMFMLHEVWEPWNHIHTPE